MEKENNEIKSGKCRKTFQLSQFGRTIQSNYSLVIGLRVSVYVIK